MLLVSLWPNENSCPSPIYVLSFYPTKSNSKSILILIKFLEFLNYNLDSNLTNCVSADLKLYDP